MPASSRGITKPECMVRLTLNDNSANDVNVRFGSKADICSALAHVRFIPESGHRWRMRPLSTRIATQSVFTDVTRCAKVVPQVRKALAVF